MLFAYDQHGRMLIDHGMGQVTAHSLGYAADTEAGRSGSRADQAPDGMLDACPAGQVRDVRGNCVRIKTKENDLKDFISKCKNDGGTARKSSVTFNRVVVSCENEYGQTGESGVFVKRTGEKIA